MWRIARKRFAKTPLRVQCGAKACCYLGAKPTFRCDDCPHDKPPVAHSTHRDEAWNALRKDE